MLSVAIIHLLLSDVITTPSGVILSAVILNFMALFTVSFPPKF
jgi:hypothetical protein